MTPLALYLATWVGPRWAKPLAWVLVIVAAIVLLWLALHLYNRHIIAQYEAEKQAQIAQDRAKADAAAQTARERDNARIEAQRKEITDVLRNVPDTAPDAASIQLNCERMRRAGAARLPEQCGSSR